jgi:hypothetical protein
MTPDLSILKAKQEALLLAEMAAWLHDMGKCSDEFLKKENRKVKSNKDKIDPYKAILTGLNNYELEGFKKHREKEINHDKALNKILKTEVVNKFNNELKVNLFNNQFTLAEIIYFGRPTFIKHANTILKNNSTEPISYLGRCHAAAHIEKEVEKGDESSCSSTPFGYENITYQNLSIKLNSLPYDYLSTILTKRITFLQKLERIFKEAPGDTRIPINEVDLWHWSSIVAALYKSALAGALLENKPEPNDLRWRLLAVRIDSERVLSDVTKIPALLARKKWISEGLDCVKKLLEEEYPLGNEVYRDENGSVFTVPDISDLLKFQDDGKSLEDLISEKLGYEGEIVVTPSISEPWWGQNSSGKPDPKKDKTPPIGDILKKKPYSPPNPERVKEWWDGVNETEVCTISWLRPQGSIGATRKASDYWAERVRGRSKEWYKDRSKTIWIDEVADENDRICLITGKLDISEWLKPDGHVKTLLVKPPDSNGGQAVPKTPSFARLRRIWETTKTFWEDVELDIEGKIRDNKKRLVVDGEIRNKDSLSENNVYEIEINRTRAAVFYTDEGKLIIVENLERLASKIGYSKNNADYYTYIQSELNDKEVKIYNSEGNSKNQSLGQLKISNVELLDDNFIPVIPLLSDPSQFMAIIPANKTIDIAKAIKKKYEAEMGKVRNRLPLSLGLTFGRSHTPIMALMDSGRRMINNPSKEETWCLVDDARQCNGDWVLSFTNGVIWSIPRLMGDKETEDVWYPYFYVEGTATDREIKFQRPKGWLVHVSKLRKGDAVKVEPSGFDFEFMDSASRRFEVSYDGTGKRRDPGKAQRPYLLEEIDDFERIWKGISENLATTQIKNVTGLIETKREEWNVSRDDETFIQFIREVLTTANWKHGVPPNLDELTKFAASGELRDIIELYLDIIKPEKCGKKDEEEVSL